MKNQKIFFKIKLFIDSLTPQYHIKIVIFIFLILLVTVPRDLVQYYQNCRSTITNTLYHVPSVLPGFAILILWRKHVPNASTSQLSITN